jgi:hypothetical protein
VPVFAFAAEEYKGGDGQNTHSPTLWPTGGHVTLTQRADYSTTESGIERDVNCPQFITTVS